MASIVEYAGQPWSKQHLAMFKLAQNVRPIFFLAVTMFKRSSCIGVVHQDPTSQDSSLVSMFQAPLYNACLPTIFKKCRREATPRAGQPAGL
jgi:hypothetical protein